MQLHQVGSQVTSGPILGPILFNAFISDKDTELESTLNKSTGNVKLEEAVDSRAEKTCRDIYLDKLKD